MKKILWLLALFVLAAEPGYAAGLYPCAANRTGCTFSTTSNATTTITLPSGTHTMAQTDSPTFTGTITAANGNFSGYLAAGSQTLTISASAFSTDASTGNFFTVTLNGATITANNPTNPVNGQRIMYEIIQDGSGSRTVSWGSAFSFGSQGAPTLTTNINLRDYVGFVYSSSLVKWVYLNTMYGY